MVLKKSLLTGSAAESFVGVYHYKITPAHWITLDSHIETNNYGFAKSSEYGTHGVAELIESSGEDFNLSLFFYKDLKLKSFNIADESKSLLPHEGYIEIDGEIREFDGITLNFPAEAEDGTFPAPHDIIRPACTSGKQFDLRIYVSLWDTPGES